MPVRRLHPDDAPACDTIIAALPDWFGDPDGIPECAEAVRAQPGFDALVQMLDGDGTRFVAVKTLSDRDPYPPYAETRAFYEAIGFTPLMDLDIWGPDNPALLLVRSLVRPPTRRADDV